MRILFSGWLTAEVKDECLNLGNDLMEQFLASFDPADKLLDGARPPRRRTLYVLLVVLVPCG